MNIDELFEDQDIFLNGLEAEYGLGPLKTDKGNNKITLKQTGIVIPEFKEIDFTRWDSINNEWPEMEYDLFPRWKTADIPVMIAAGFISALISNRLFEPFAKLHDSDWMQNPFTKGGHSGEDADRVRGILHRLKHGHDPFNPFEVNWKDYFPQGAAHVSLLGKVGYWLRHLLQDSFSTEGLPLPGTSYFRNLILNIDGIKDPKNPLYKTFLTLKMRDITGTAFIAATMSLYVYGTERGEKRKFFNYRYTSLTIGALLTSIASGLILTPPII